MKLMVPGPAQTWPQDLAEMARPTLPHYGQEFLDCWNNVNKMLKTILGTSANVLMIPGAGTAGTEMALCGFAGKKCIVVRTGTFGDRLAEILQAHGANVLDLHVPDRQAVYTETVEKALAEDPDLAAVCMVHSETSTGILH